MSENIARSYFAKVILVLLHYLSECQVILQVTHSGSFIVLEIQKNFT